MVIKIKFLFKLPLVWVKFKGENTTDSSNSSSSYDRDKLHLKCTNTEKCTFSFGDVAKEKITKVQYP